MPSFGSFFGSVQILRTAAVVDCARLRDVFDLGIQGSTSAYHEIASNASSLDSDAQVERESVAPV